MRVQSVNSQYVNEWEKWVTRNPTYPAARAHAKVTRGDKHWTRRGGRGRGGGAESFNRSGGNARTADHSHRGDWAIGTAASGVLF